MIRRRPRWAGTPRFESGIGDEPDTGGERPQPGVGLHPGIEGRGRIVAKGRRDEVRDAEPALGQARRAIFRMATWDHPEESKEALRPSTPGLVLPNDRHRPACPGLVGALTCRVA
jgi:hypothetical protein